MSENILVLEPANLQLISRIIGWIIVWCTLYKSSFNIFKTKNSEYNCRTVTLLHAVVITITSCYISFFNGTNPFETIGLPNTQAQILILTSSLGYFIFDFVWCMYHQTEGLVMLIHHVISVTFLSVSLALGESGTEVVATLFGSEITSIVLNIRWFAKQHEMYDGYFGVFVDAVFFTSFLCVRLGVGGYLAYRVLISNRPSFLIQLGGTSFYIVNYMFFIQILLFVRHRVKKLYLHGFPKKTDKSSQMTSQNGYHSQNGNHFAKSRKKNG